MIALLSLTVAFLLAQPPANETKAPQDAPPKKVQTEGNSDLQKLTPAVLNDMAKRIETALIGDVSTGTLGLKVAVEEQMIVLNGDAPDEEARKRASEIATGVAGDELYRIANRVRIKPAGTEAGSRKEGVTDTPTAPDLAQLERVDAVIREKVPDLAPSIRARFRVDPMPCVVLEGVVDTMEQKVEVSRAIRGEVRALPILNNIAIRIKQNTPTPRPAAPDERQPRVNQPQNKAVALDSDTHENDMPLAGVIANKIMGDSRIWDSVVLIQADGGLIWLKGTVETFAHKVRCVNHAERTQGVTYVIDDLTVAVALRGAQELSVAKQKSADLAIVNEDAAIYFRRYLGESIPVAGAYTVAAEEGQIRVVLRGNLLSPEQLKRVSDSVQKMAADLGVKAVIDVQPTAAGTPKVVTPPAP